VGKFIHRRIDDMLTRYGDITVAEAAEDAEKRGESLTPFFAELARHAGESRAWAVHDSFFIWERPLSNTFDELRDYICEQDSMLRSQMIRNWADLKKRVMTLAVDRLCRMQYPPLPVFLPDDVQTTWWIYMAILHQCCIELREII